MATEKEKNERKEFWIKAGAIVGIYALGYFAGKKAMTKTIKKELKNYRRLNFGNGITMPMFYHKDNEPCIIKFFECIDAELVELRDLKGGLKK